MADAVTWINVASDFVKIGSGAIVGGIIAVYGDSRKYKRERVSALADYERDMLKDIAIRFGRYYVLVNDATYSLYLYSVNLANPGASQDGSFRSIAEINASRLELYKRRAVIDELYNELLLISAKKAAESLKDLNDILFGIFPSYKELKDDDLKNYSDIDDSRMKLIAKKNMFIEDLSASFKRM